MGQDGADAPGTLSPTTAKERRAITAAIQDQSQVFLKQVAVEHELGSFQESGCHQPAADGAM